MKCNIHNTSRDNVWHYIYSQHNVVLNYINWREIKKAIKKEKTRGKKETYVLNISAVLSLIMPSNNNAARKPDQKKIKPSEVYYRKGKKSMTSILLVLCVS